MAGHGGQNNNYWPGFVDALANMIMAMIFIIMIFMILMLHYKIEGAMNKLQKVQGQAKVENAAPDSPVTSDAPGLPSSAQGAASSAAQSQASVAKLQAEVARLKQELQAQQAAAQQAAADQAAAQRAAQAQQTAQTLLESREPTSAVSSMASVPGKPEPIKAEHGDYLGAAPGSGKNPPTVTGDGAVWRVTWANSQGYELDAQAKTALHGLVDTVKSHPGARLKLIAPAILGVGYSDSRRLAYYRALGVRNALIEAGWPAAAVDVEIVDHSSAEQSQEVLIQPITQTAAAHGAP